MPGPVTAALVLHVFDACGIELEYMIVDRQSLSVAPLADRVLRAGNSPLCDVDRGHLGWSNELVLHVLEVKNQTPDASLDALPAAFQQELSEIGRRLEPLGAALMPTGMHPWMNPAAETRLWPHRNADLYRTFDRLFDCCRHGWANLQSMHVNLPFADDAEFARLHAATRLVLPILPALAASTPIAEGRNTGFLDYRLEVYRTNSLSLPSITGDVIPEEAADREDYRRHILEPMYREIAPLDPQGLLQQEWLNSRGAIARFERNALEIRVLDMQECPHADLAIAAATTAAVRQVYEGGPAPAVDHRYLVELFHTCSRQADQAVIDDAPYLARFGIDASRCLAGELWRHIIERWRSRRPDQARPWERPLQTILDYGPLARRILRAVGPDCRRDRLHAVYGELCLCLRDGRLFLPS